MAGVQGIKEKVHLPIYDSLRVEPKKQLRDIETSNILKFFVDVRGKTKLETNASLFSQFDRFEVTAMRVVISDLPPEFPVDITVADTDLAVNRAGNLIAKLIYNTVTTLFVGDQIKIQMPTWFFPGGAGPRSDTASVTTHGEPSPTSTFRFAEPIFIDKQQNFRVEVEVPHADFLNEMQRFFGPLFIWVVLDGFMTRDAQ
jgi:hypothetical protein